MPIVCDASILAWVGLGLLLGIFVGVVGTLLWGALFTDLTHD